MDNSILHIVGHRGHAWPQLDGWSPGYPPVVHHRRVWRGAIPGFVLMGLGLALFIAAWAHRRQDR